MFNVVGLRFVRVMWLRGYVRKPLLICDCYWYILPYQFVLSSTCANKKCSNTMRSFTASSKKFNLKCLMNHPLKDSYLFVYC